jgi:hypothetical protein
VVGVSVPLLNLNSLSRNNIEYVPRQRVAGNFAKARSFPKRCEAHLFGAERNPRQVDVHPDNIPLFVAPGIPAISWQLPAQNNTIEWENHRHSSI